MKTKIIMLALVGCGILSPLFGARTRTGELIQPTTLTNPSSYWDTAGTITTSQATLGVSARDFSAVWTDLSDAKTVKWAVPEDVSGVEFRFQTDDNADAHVVEMWVSAGTIYRDGSQEEHFMLGGTFTLTGGQQVGPNTNVFVDTFTVTEMIINNGEVVDSGNDRVSVYKVDLRGYKRAVFIATTLEGSATLRLDVRNF